MSAYIATCFPDRVEILTDGAGYSPTGVLLTTLEKVKQIPGFPAVVITRGVVRQGDHVARVIADLFRRVGSFDAAIDALGDALAKGKADTGDPIEVVIAGISEADGPSIAYWATAQMPDAPAANVLHTTRESLICGLTNSLAHADFMAHGSLSSRGLQLMEHLRRKPPIDDSSRDAGIMSIIGGHVDHAVVTAAGTTTTRLRTWDDAIGEKLGATVATQSPKPVVALPALANKPSRAARRASIAQKRKAA